MKRRIIAALMCLCMLVGLLPMSAFAADPGTVTATKEVVDQTPDGNGNYTIKLSVQGEPVQTSSASAADVVLVVDNSGSMASSVGEPCLAPKKSFKEIELEWWQLWRVYECPDCGARYSSSLGGWLWDTRPEKCTGQKGAEPRIDTAKNVSKTFAQSILNGKNDNQLAVIGFAHKSENGGPNDAGALFVTQPLTNDLAQINNKIEKMDADGGTNYSAALQQAYTWLKGREDKSRPAYVIFISDGAPGLSGESIGNSQWNGSNQAEALKRDGVTLYTIGIALTDDESNYLESLATDSNHYINVTGTTYATQLEKVLLEWASHINSVPAGKNAVMTDVVNTEYFDVVTPLPAGVTLGEDGKTLTWDIGNIPKDRTSVEFKIKPKADVLATFTGTRLVNTNTNVSLAYVDCKNQSQTIPKEKIGEPKVTLTGTKPAEYTLTYEGNAQSSGTVDELPSSTQHPAEASVTLSTQRPTHTAVEVNPDDEKATAVVFIGWTEDRTEKIFAKGDIAPTTVTSVNMVEGGKTVYAAWGYDANGDGNPDVTENGYTLTYYGNAQQEGTVENVPTDDNTYLSGVSVTLITDPKPTHSKVNDTAVVFVGWTSEQTNKIYSKDDAAPTTVTSVNMVEGGKTVYAAWGYDTDDDGNPDVTETKYTLTYHANGGIAITLPTDPNNYLSGETATLSTKLPEHENVDGKKVECIGWSTTPDQKIYSAGENYGDIVSEVTFANANITVYAVWRYDSNDDDGHHSKYTLYYHSNFGEDVSFYQSSSTRNVTVKEYDDVGRLPERDGYVFVSWNTEPDGSGTRYMPGDPFRIERSSDHLYAQWQKDKTGPDDSGVSNWLETDEHRAYLTGYPDSTFRADRNMTRAEVAQMFYALLLDKNVTITKSFSDVPDDAWYSTAVKTLASLGMMDGYPDGTFRPDEPITRAEFATVGLAFAYDPLDADCSYYDVSASAWYHTYVAQATTYGWIGGYPDNTFRPGNNITRVEVCVIVNNMLGRDADERYIDRHEDELVHFVDLSDSYWGYYTIMESTNTHEYTGSFTNEKWTDVK